MSNKLIAVVIVAVTVSHVFGDDVPCKSCDENVDKVFTMVGKALSGLEPITLDDVEICKEASMEGMYTIKRGGETCIAKGEGTLNHQKATIFLKQVKFGCVLKSLQETLDKLNIPIKIPSISIPNPFGSKKEEKKEPKRMVNGTWSDLKVEMKMDLDFTNDIYNVTDCKILGHDFTTLKLWCEGDTAMTTICGALTKPEPFRMALGAVVQIVARVIIGEIVRMPQLAEYITLLNCGEDEK